MTTGAEIEAKESRFWTSRYNDKQFFGVQHVEIRCKTADSKSSIWNMSAAKNIPDKSSIFSSYF